MKIITTTLMAFGLVAVALCFIPPRCVQIPIGAWLRKAPVMPPSDGGGETLESTPFQWPKTYKAPDGVNTITENEDGTGSMTLAWVPPPKPGEMVIRGNDDTYSWVTVEEAAKRQQKHVITQEEAEEVRTIIRDSLNAHNFALDFHKTAVIAFKTEEDQEAILKNIGRVTQSATRLLEFEAKWRKRVEEGKP